MPRRVSHGARASDSQPTPGMGPAMDGIDTTTEFLARYGYLPGGLEGAEPEGTLTIALVKYQARHGLPLSGVLDEATQEMMSRGRCGFPDLDPATGLEFTALCTWGRDSLTYAFSSGTADVAGDAERAAVRRAFATWSVWVQIAFREVGTGDSPDILIGWTPANCGDANMTGNTLAHSDYPPGCGFYGNALPRPFHFDDQEHTWADGAVAGQFDVETVALHEIGHLLGLAHTNVAGAVMFPTVAVGATLRMLQPDDIEGIRRLYPIRGPVFARHSGRCMDIAWGSADNGADLIQWDYWGGANQIFRIEWVEASHYRLIAQHSGKVLDVEGAAPGNGAPCSQYDWWGGDNQKFRLDPVGQGYFRIVAKHSGRVLDVWGVSADAGAIVHQWDWWGGGNQQWRLGPAPIFSRHSGKALDVAGISLANGAQLIQFDYWGGANQHFRLDPVGDGYYRIVIQHTGKCLDVWGLSTDNGAPVIQWEYWGGPNQQWRPDPTGDGFYRLVARHSGKVLDVAGISAANDAIIQQWDWWGGGNQQWRL